MAPKVMERTRAKTNLRVDYPRQSEVIESAEYTLRISTPKDAKDVDVAIDQGEWRPCRLSVGYWWYDWSGYGSGEHEIVARMKPQKGKRSNSDPHKFFVKLPA